MENLPCDVEQLAANGLHQWIIRMRERAPVTDAAAWHSFPSALVLHYSGMTITDNEEAIFPV
jgi:hypothetical protein